MAEHISLSIFGTFGNPNGFTQSIAGSVASIKKYDLNPTAIQLFETTKAMYALRKEVAGKEGIVSFIKYSYATEQGSTRGGTFVGAAVINANGIADINSVVSVLNTLHTNLIKNPNNVKDGIIMVKHSNEFNIEDPSVDNLKISSQASADIDFSEKGRNLVVFSSLGNIPRSLVKALDLLNDYDTIFFTDDEKVAKYVQEKGLYELIQEVGEIKQFTQKLQALDAAKIEKQKALVEKLLKDINLVKFEKESYREKQQEAINKNKEIHQKNFEKITEAERNLIKYTSSFDQQIARLQNLQQKLSAGHLKLADRKQIEKEIAQLHASFDTEKRAFTEPTRLEPFSESRKPQITQPSRTTHWEDTNEYSRHREKSPKGFSSMGILFIVSIFIFIGVVGAAAWYYLKEPAVKFQTTENYTGEDVNTVSTQPENTDSLKIELRPKPTGFLSAAETEKTIKKQFPTYLLPMEIDSVVGRIMKANPTDIGKPYKVNAKEYGDYLIQQNPNNFDADRKLTKSDHLQIAIYKEGFGSNQTNITPQNEEKLSPATVDDIKNRK